ncbi:hypothetical protein Bbelb_365980 [Branchiostoma belcheri]|nr:hypothetical protein Bbelb_365980 [Branchiostoma belcheri]
MVTEDKPAVFLGCVRAQLTLFVTGSNRSHITDTWHMARYGKDKLQVILQNPLTALTRYGPVADGLGTYQAACYKLQSTLQILENEPTVSRPGCVNYLRGYTRSSGCVLAMRVRFPSTRAAMALRPYGDQRCRRAIAALAERCCAGLAGDDSPRRDEEQAAAAAVPGLLLPRIEETLSKKMDVLVRPTVGRNVFITVRQVLTADLGLRNK